MVPSNPPPLNPIKWNTHISALPGAHILQTWEWGKVKSQFGWQPYYIYWLEEQSKIEHVINRHLDERKIKHLAAAALVLHRRITIGGFSHRMGVIYVPKGPLLDWANTALRKQVLQDIEVFAQKHSAIFVKIDPDVEVGIGILGINEAIRRRRLATARQYRSETGRAVVLHPGCPKLGSPGRPAHGLH